MADAPLDLRGLTVLIVEDHADSREALRAIVASRGATVRAAEDGLQALMMAWEQRPDLVLCDLQMPTMDGYTFIRQLRRDPELARTPVIAVSGYGSQEEVHRTWTAGFSGHLVKPVDGDTIAAQLARAFPARRGSLATPLAGRRQG